MEQVEVQQDHEDLRRQLLKGCSCQKCRHDLCCCDVMDEAAEAITNLTALLDQAEEALARIAKGMANMRNLDTGQNFISVMDSADKSRIARAALTAIRQGRVK